jgi:tryptophanyl-tRNA synthetase
MERGLVTGAEGKKSRVLSGMRPTGRLHIGHYFGALQNWVRLQNDPAYECFYFIADWHALTSDYADTSAVAENTLQIMMDYLAAGLDPGKSVIFQQSVIPEHAELHLLLSMVTPLGWLERVPTYKEALENVKDKDLHNYGFLGYPVLQTADIVIYSEEGAQLYVPVGEDQVSHVEVSREIVRRFKSFYDFKVNEERFTVFLRNNLDARENFVGFLRDVMNDAESARNCPGDELPNFVRCPDGAAKVHRYIQKGGLDNFLEAYPIGREFVDISEALIEPQVMLTKTPRIPGLDGRKMSKSYGNAITLSETDEGIRMKTRVMKTDPARQRRTDKGDPDKCPVYDWHKLFSADEKGRLEWVQHGCRTAEIGCIECKKAMADNLVRWIAPIRERRVKWENDKKGVVERLDEGSRKARRVAQATMERVRESVFHWKDKFREIAVDQEDSHLADFLLDTPRKISPED